MLRAIASAASVVGFFHLLPVAFCATSSVSILFQDQLGNPFPPGFVKLTVTSDSAGSSPLQFRGHTVDLPYGTYTVSAWSPGFITRKQPLVVWQEAMTVRISLLVGAPHGSKSRSEIGGVVVPAVQSPDFMTTRLVPLAHAAFIQEDAVTSEGRFSFGEVEHGEYLLMLVSWTKTADGHQPTVVYTNQTTVSHDRQDLSIELPR